MFLTEHDSGHLKKWIVKRLDSKFVQPILTTMIRRDVVAVLMLTIGNPFSSSTSLDADPEILADYIIALLKHDGDEESVRNICLSEIPDFLESKEGWRPTLPLDTWSFTLDADLAFFTCYEGKKCDPVSFVNDVLDAIFYRAYLPGKSLPEVRGPRPQMTPLGHVPDQSAAATPNAAHSPGRPPPQPVPVATAADPATSSGSRKRAFQGMLGQEQPNTNQNLLEAGGRPAKQPRSFVTQPTAYQKVRLTQRLTETRGLPSHANPTAVPTSTTYACAQSTLAPPSEPRPSSTSAPGFEKQHSPYSHDTWQGLLYLQSPHPPPPGYPMIPTVHREAAPQTPKRGRRALCKAWRTFGFCPRGTACKFAHISAQKLIPNTGTFVLFSGFFPSFKIYSLIHSFFLPLVLRC